jgi:hypothetical protein
VVEFSRGEVPLAGPLGTELASLQDAELIHLLDVVLVERGLEGGAVVRVPSADELGDLDGIGLVLGSFLGPDDLTDLADGVEPGRLAAVVVWEDTWAEHLVTLSRECGGTVVANGTVAPEGSDRAPRVALVRAPDRGAP